jgi:hypothetical protein
MNRSLRINAWNPELDNSGALSPNWYGWTSRERMQRFEKILAFEDGPDLRNWKHPKIGWGVVLPENEQLSAKERALPLDLPAKVQAVIARRNGVVLRHRADLAPEKVARYYADDGRRQDFRVLGSEAGIDVGEMPVYLLILASPAKIPWQQQYLMSGNRFVGRLDLADDALENYFAHLDTDWQGSAAKPLAPLLWSVDWDGDITALMRQMVAEPAYTTYKTDPTIDPLYLHGAGATSAALTDALRCRNPGMVVTTSHGATSPLDNVEALCAGIGMPVDQDKKLLNGAALLKAWQPDGVIWYAHACCSAGTDANTSYAGLFDPATSVDRILQGVTQAGSRVAPLPTALLSAEKPARAFVGHVEPTFDWPLQDPETGQPLSLAFSEALTKKLYAAHRHPIGSAFRDVHALAPAQFGLWYRARDDAQRMTDPVARQRTREMALRAQLGGLDWQGVVILGDPTVAIALA